MASALCGARATAAAAALAKAAPRKTLLSCTGSALARTTTLLVLLLAGRAGAPFAHSRGCEMRK